MEWETLLSQMRLGKENDTSSRPSFRTAFEADVDKVVYAGAFRRLGRKTQVHPLASNDHIHTRLTHSLEVAQVGRALGKDLGSRIASELPKELSAYDLAAVVEAACLAHDIGNPPFGHAGEEAMAHWFELNGPKFFRSLSEEYNSSYAGF